MGIPWTTSDERNYPDGTRPGWNRQDAPDAWDRLTIGSFRIPGIANVVAKVKRKIERQKIKGAAEQIIDRGYEPAEGSIEITVWTSAQWDELVRVFHLLVAKNGTPDKSSYQVSHPQFAFLRINAIKLSGFGTMSSGQAPKTVTWDFIEFVQEEAVTVKKKDTTTKPTISRRNVDKRSQAVQKYGESEQQKKQKKPSSTPGGPSSRST